MKPDDGIYLDQIGIGDECQFVYRTELKAELQARLLKLMTITMVHVLKIP